MKQLLKLSACGFVLLTAGCSQVKSELGLDRHTPDEFAVMQRAPLEIPADLTTLPKPQPGMPRPQDVTAKQQAQEVILGTPAKPPAAQEVAVSAKPSAAENALVNKIGGGTTDAQIRAKIANEKEDEKDTRPVVKRIFGIGSETVGSNVLDAQGEAERIQKAKKAGKPITEGETPSMEN